MHKLIHKRKKDILGYVWVDNNNTSISPFIESLSEAEAWYIEHQKQTIESCRRIRVKNRRWGIDRRKRSSFHDRRNDDIGRRWCDHVRYHQSK